MNGIATTGTIATMMPASLPRYSVLRPIGRENSRSMVRPSISPENEAVARTAATTITTTIAT